MKIKQIENHIIRYACLFAGLLFIYGGLDNDCWFLLNHGRYAVEQGIPHIEPFTIHENFAFVMQQWLTSVIFWEIYQYFSAEGLVLFLHPIGALTIYAFYRLTLIVSKENRDTAFILSSLVGIVICFLFIRTRPQIFSMLIFIMEIISLEMLRQSAKKKYILIFPVLSMALVNLHAAMWPMLFIFLLPFLFDHLARYDIKGYFVHDERINMYTLGVIAVLIILAGFINPYGWDAMTYVFRSYGYDMISNYVNEMKPITVRTLAGMLSELLFLFVIIAYVRHKIAIRHLLLTLGTMFMALSSFRSLYLFLVVGLYPLAFVYRDWQGLTNVNASTDNLRLRKILIVMIDCVFAFMIVNEQDYIWDVLGYKRLALILVVMLPVFLFGLLEWRYGSLQHVKDRLLRCGYASVILIMSFVLLLGLEYKLLNSEKLPDSALAVEYLLEHEQADQVRLWTNYNEGGYPEFRGLRCFIDPRAEVFLISNNKQRDVFYEFFSLMVGKTDYRTFLSWYDFNYILVCENDIMYTYLPNDANYELVLSYRSDKNEEYRLYHAKSND